MINIITSVKGLNDQVIGANENSCMAITKNFYKSGVDCRIISMPPKNASKLQKILKNITMLFKIIFAVIRNEDLLFIYPSIPLYPATSTKKYHIANAYYSILNAIKRKTKILIYVLDLPKEQEEGLGLKKIKINKDKFIKFENKLFSMSDELILVSEGFKSLLAARGIFEEYKIKALTVLLEIKDGQAEKHVHGKTEIFYSGELTREYEKNMIKKISEVLSDNEELIICGREGEWINEEKLAHLVYKGYVDMNTHNDIAKSCDFAIICYPNTGYYKYVNPSKLRTYISLGLPVLSIETDTVSKIIEEFEIGECVEEKDFLSRLRTWCDEDTYCKYKDVYNSSDFYAYNIQKLRDLLKEMNVSE